MSKLSKADELKLDLLFLEGWIKYVERFEIKHNYKRKYNLDITDENTTRSKKIPRGKHNSKKDNHKKKSKVR